MIQPLKTALPAARFTLPHSGAAWARVVAVTFLFNSAIALILLPLVGNTYPDLWISAQVLGFTIVAFLLPTLRLTQPGARRILALAGALLAAALIGTTLVVHIKGRQLAEVFDSPGYLEAFAVTAMLGIVIGAVFSLIMVERARIAVAENALLKAEAERQQLARQTAEVELQLLKAQIEPHFLFNTLANLSYLIRQDADKAVLLLENLIDYLQAAMPRIRTSSGTLRQEIALCSAYLHIHQIRMGKQRLHFSVDIPSALDTLPFPPMMLITLVENALKHGIGPRPEGGCLTIRGHSLPHRLVIEVVDDGPGPTAAAQAGKSDGIGLRNIRDRLQVMFGAAASVELQANPTGGTCARIEVPV